MIRICTRATLRSSTLTPLRCSLVYRQFSSTSWRKEDPRIEDFGREIVDEFAVLREKYGTYLFQSSLKLRIDISQMPQYVHRALASCSISLTIAQKHTVVLAHGLLGFDELRLAGRFIPGIHYWRGITDALAAKGIEVLVAAVPPSGSIEARSAKLAESIAQKAKGKQINIIAYVGVYQY